MSNQRWDLCLSHQDKNGKWRSTKVGVIFAGKEGRLNIRIEPGVSISTPEAVLLTGYPPKDSDPLGGSRGDGRRAQKPAPEDSFGSDDDIPF